MAANDFTCAWTDSIYTYMYIYACIERERESLNRLYLYIYVYIRICTHIESVWTDADDPSYLKMAPFVPEPTLYIHTCIYTHIYRERESEPTLFIHICICTHIHTYRECLNRCRWLVISENDSICAWTDSIYTHMHIYAYMHIYRERESEPTLFIHICIYTHIHTYRECLNRCRWLVISENDSICAWTDSIYTHMYIYAYI